MNSNWVYLVHPLTGLIAVVFAAIVALYGWRYRNARLGKSGKDVLETFNLQKVHKWLGITFLALTIFTWLLEVASDYRWLGSNTHSIGAIALVILMTTSATIILRFRRRRWASPVHLTLNGIILALVTVQLLSGLKILKY